MRRPGSRIGAELVPLAMALACLAGALALIVSIHRRAATVPAPKPRVEVARVEPTPPPAPPKPAPVAVAQEPAPEPDDQPEPPPPPPPVDPTPKELAKLAEAEAEQIREATDADRKAAALEVARKAAVAESERWRRREAMVRLQLGAIDSRVRAMEAEVDELAVERDALEKERDIKKALAAQAQSRPTRAILPHRGPNGTWRRPIVVECSNGMAILQPQNIGFGLFELSMGFGPSSNPFVGAIAREAIRIQGNKSPDGRPVVPYIFFLVRPDGIRAYYEARGRLEALGITFGYELADQDWEVDFPDLDDLQSWDGSAPAAGSSRGAGSNLPSGASRPMAARPLPEPGGVPGPDEFPDWPNAGRPSGVANDRDAEFLWPRSPRMGANRRGRVALGSPGATGSGGSAGSGLAEIPPGGDGNGPAGGGGRTSLGGSQGGGLGSRPVAAAFPNGYPSPRSTPEGRGQAQGPAPAPVSSTAGDPTGNDPASAPPGGRNSGGRAVAPASTDPGGADGPESGTAETPSTIRAEIPRAGGRPTPADSAAGPGAPADGPLSGLEPGGRTLPARPQPSEDLGSDDLSSPDRSPPVLHTGPFTKPLAMGLDSLTAAAGNLPPTSEVDPTAPEGNPAVRQDRPGQAGRYPPSASAATDPAGPSGSEGPPGTATPGLGRGSPAATTPPPGAIGVAMPGMQAPDMPRPPDPPPMIPPDLAAKMASRKLPSRPEPPTARATSRRFEIVVACGPRGVIVQPGAYRVTSDALKDHDDLMKKQMIALVKAKRTADPGAKLEPTVRFLVQPGGEATFWAARGQYLTSGLGWPSTFKAAPADPLSWSPSEGW